MASIRLKTALVAAVPLAGFLITSAIDLAQRYQIRDGIAAIAEHASGAILATELVHELQKERGASALYLGSDGSEMAVELKAQRATVDQRLTAYKAVQRAGSDDPGKALAETRANVWSLAIPGAESFHDYSAVIAKLIDDVARIGTGSEGAAGGLARVIAPYVSLVQAKELAGQERALGTALIAAGAYDAERHLAFAQAVARQEQMVALFLRGAGADDAAMFAAKMATPIAEQAIKARDTLLDYAARQDLRGLTARKWVELSTSRIELLKLVEDHLAADLKRYATDARDQATRSLLIGLAAAAAVLVVVLVLSTLIIRGITGPLIHLARYTTRLAEGSAHEPVPSTTRTDEIGEVARAVEVFRAAQDEVDRLREEQRASREREQEERRREMHDLADSLEGQVHSVIQLVCENAGHITDRATGMGQKIDGATNRSLDTIEAADRTAASIQMVASATEELSHSIAEISERVAQSSAIAQTAAAETRSVNDSVRELSVAVRQIDEIVTMINDIASQTNLLALNATIEAARAGEAGKGFAVVAGEVKGLASQTARATSEVGSRIESIVKATKDSVEALARATQTISALTELSAAVAAAVEQQGCATREIALHTQTVNAEAQQVRTNVIDVTNATASSYSSAIQVLWSAEDLDAPANKLRQEVDAFLSRIRA